MNPLIPIGGDYRANISPAGATALNGVSSRLSTERERPMKFILFLAAATIIVSPLAAQKKEAFNPPGTPAPRYTAT